MADRFRRATCALAFLSLAACTAGREEILLGLTSPDPGRRIQAIRRVALLVPPGGTAEDPDLQGQ